MYKEVHGVCPRKLIGGDTIFEYVQDPGHGWVKVTSGDALLVGLSRADFSDCSFYRGGYLWLEEDCDAPKFINAYKARHGYEPKLNEVVVNHYVRK